MIQEYYKSERMKELEAHARKLERFHEIRRVSMAANIVDGHLIIGNRHFCPLMTNQIDLLGLDSHKHGIRYDQGFVDQWGIYMSREEAFIVAKERGQIRKVHVEGTLFSEDYL